VEPDEQPPPRRLLQGSAGDLSGGALTLAAAAACVHAGWNLLLAGAPDPRAAAALALPVGVLLLAPFAIALWDVGSAAIPYMAASAVLETAYFFLLTAGYGRADLGAVYPLVRGSAPVLVLGVSVAFLGAHLSAWAAVGVLLVAAGVVAIRGVRREAEGRAVVLALLCGATVAGYTLVDNEGVTHAGPVPYLTVVLAPVAVFSLLVARRSRGWPALAAYARSSRANVLAAGAGMVGAYVLTLAALKLAPAAPVAAVRETSVLIAVIAAALLGRERLDRVRLAAAVAVTAGTAAIALG
jgi:drug/metabolite transporter (DMT)-like permease